MKIFGLDIRRVEKQQMTAVPVRGGFWQRLIEPFSGAWQQNVEEKLCTMLSYPTLYACLNRISQDIGKLPFQLKRMDSNGIWKLEPSNTSYWPVLRKPNNYQTQQQFRESWVLSKLTQGNTYALKQRDARGVVNRLYILDPCNVLPLVADSGDVYYQLNFPSASNLLPQEYPATQLVVPASEIIHDRLNTFHHPLIGVPPMCAAYWPAVKNLKILKDATKFFTNGANPGGILTAPAGMSDDDAKTIKDYWNTNFNGDNAGKVAVIGADMKFTPFSFKAADSQLVEQMTYSDQQICQPFGIHPFIVGIGSIPAGMKTDDITNTYYQFALQSHIEAMENLLDDGLSISAPLGIELDLDPLLRMDFGKRADVMGNLVSNSIATPNEARLAFGYIPLEGGDTVYMQQQDFALSDLAKRSKLPNPFVIDRPAPNPTPSTEGPADEADPQEQEAAKAKRFGDGFSLAFHRRINQGLIRATQATH